ncbi:MAG: TolC family protein [Candidatus Aminicenantes bacterium]|nr:TolC family protein [Candidatus Aminicenantes bacterium]
MINTTRRNHIKIHAFFLIAGYFFSAITASAASSPQHKTKTRSFSLEAAREFAVQHNYDAVKSRLDVESAGKKIRETTAAGLPQISSSLNYLNNLELTTVLIPNFFEGKFDEKIPVQFGTQHNATFTVQVNQLVFNGSYFVGLQTSKIYRRLADQGLERTELDIQETVTDTYFLILVSEESEKILQASLNNLQKTHFEIKELHKEGFVSETDVDLIQVSVNSLKNGLQALRRQIEVAYKLLKFQMGLELGEKIELEDSLYSFIQALNPEKAWEAEFELEDNLDYQLLQTQEKLAELALKNEKSKYLPTVSAFYSYQRNSYRDKIDFFSKDANWFRAQILGINVSIPLFKSGAQSARVKQASLALEKARKTRIQAGEGLRLEMERAVSGLKSAYDNYINMKTNRELSEKIYHVTLEKYKEGVSSSMELTQAHDKYLNGQSQYIQAMSGLLSAKNRLDRITHNY